MNEYLAIWGDVNFLVPMIILILVSAIAIFFEYKWLDERKKNKEYHRFHTYTNIPTIPTSNRNSKIKKISGSKPLLGLAPNIIASQLNIPPNTVIKKAVKTLLIIIKRIISGVKRGHQPNANKTNANCLINHLPPSFTGIRSHKN